MQESFCKEKKKEANAKISAPRSPLATYSAENTIKKVHQRL